MDARTREPLDMDSDDTEFEEESSEPSSPSATPLPRRLSRNANLFPGARYQELLARDAEIRQADAARLEAIRQQTGSAPLSSIPRHIPFNAMMDLDPLGGYSQEVWDENDKIKKHLARMANSTQPRPPRLEPTDRLSIIHEANPDSPSIADAEAWYRDRDYNGIPELPIITPHSAPYHKLGPLTRRVEDPEIRRGYRIDELDYDYFEEIARPILPHDLILICSTTEGNVSTGIVFSHRQTLYIALGEFFDIRRIATPDSEDKLLSILEMYKFPEAIRSRSIVLAPADPLIMFEDVQRKRWFTVMNLHNWAIAQDNEHWVIQKCGCEYCDWKTAEEGEAGPAK